MIFCGFTPSRNAAIQAFKLMSTENYYLRKFIFHKQSNFSYLGKSATYWAFQKVSCWKSLVKLANFYDLFAYKQEILGIIVTGNVTWFILMKVKPLFNYLPPPSITMEEIKAISYKWILKTFKKKNIGLQYPMKYILKSYMRISSNLFTMEYWKKIKEK